MEGAGCGWDWDVFAFFVTFLLLLFGGQAGEGSWEGNDMIWGYGCFTFLLALLLWVDCLTAGWFLFFFVHGMHGPVQLTLLCLLFVVVLHCGYLRSWFQGRDTEEEERKTTPFPYIIVLLPTKSWEPLLPPRQLSFLGWYISTFISNSDSYLQNVTI